MQSSPPFQVLSPERESGRVDRQGRQVRRRKRGRGPAGPLTMTQFHAPRRTTNEIYLVMPRAYSGTDTAHYWLCGMELYF